MSGSRCGWTEAAEQRLAFALEAPNAETRAAITEADTIARQYHARFTTAAELVDDPDQASRE